MDTVRRTVAALVIACFLPAAGYCAASETAKGGTGVSCHADMRILLNAYSAYSDQYFSSIIRDLKLLASTSEVGSGGWEAMSGLLDEFDRSGIAAAAVWYARPDGGYYTVEKGLTGESLADRPYFSGLIAGDDVVGELVISRSTGKRSAIFAVSVWTGGEVTGALGVSLSVEEVSRMLNEKMGLPSDFVFYALDSKGRTSLHEKPELLFEYPSDVGSETLSEAVNTMMSEDEGVVHYEFQGRKTVYFRRSPLTGWVYALGHIAGIAPAAK